MPPGTVHTVMTVFDSVSTGGLFFVPTLFNRSLDTLIELHEDGRRLSNSDYPGAQVHYFHLLASYHLSLSSYGFYNDPPHSAKEVYDRLRKGKSRLSPRFSFSDLWQMGKYQVLSSYCNFATWSGARIG